jgi:HK97 family phage major capsid protein
MVRQSRAAIATDVAEHVADAEARSATLSEDEAKGLTWHLAVKRAEDDVLIEREKELVEVDRRAGIAASLPTTPATIEKRTDATHVSGEPRVYAKNNGQSYFLDFARAETGRGDSAAARARLALHGKQSDDEIEGRSGGTPFETRVNPNRTDGQGGFFVPPIWLIDQFVPLFRAGRTTADLVRHIDLPAGTDSINIPKVLTGTSAAIQTADNAAVSSTDLTDTSVSGAVKTVAGQQDVALQLLEQSPISFDEVIYADLLRAYNVALDVQVLSGSNAAGQVKGILTVASPTAVTYTSGSPTAQLLYAAIAQLVSQVSYAATGRFDLTDSVLVMHPRRWFSLVAAVDTAGRPLVVPVAPAFNPLATMTEGIPAAVGLVGTILGIPTYIDASVPTNLGAGTNEDRVILVPRSDVFLFEGAIRTRALSEVLSGTLQVRIQLYNYLAVIADRLPGAIGVISGTGLVAPSGF